MDINRVIADQVSKGKQLAFVRSVYISDSRLSDRGVELLCKWAPYCTDLHIKDCPNVTDVGVKCIAGNLTNLTEFSIEGATITDDAIKHASTLKKLEHLEIEEYSNSTTPESMNYIRDLPRLEYLEFPCHWNIDDEDRAWLVREKIFVFVLLLPQVNYHPPIVEQLPDFNLAELQEIENQDAREHGHKGSISDASHEARVSSILKSLPHDGFPPASSVKITSS